MFTRPLNPRMGPMRTGNKRQELIQQIARQKAAGVQRKFPAIARGAKERFGGFGHGPKSMGGARPIFGQGGMPGSRDFLPMPGFDRPRGGGWGPVNPNNFGLAPVEPGLPGGMSDFVQQIQDFAAGGGPMRPDASGPINWGALGIPDPQGQPQQMAAQSIYQQMPGYLAPGQSQTLQSGAQMAPSAALGIGQQGPTAGGLIPLGGGQYLDPSTGVVHGVGGLGMM